MVTPVPGLGGVSGMHQRSKIRGKGVFEGKIYMSLILENKRSFLDRKFVKIRKGGLIFPTLFTIYGKLGETHLKVQFSLL